MTLKTFYFAFTCFNRVSSHYFSKSFISFCIILIALFQFQFFSSQQTSDQHYKEVSYIYIKNGTEIYSSDEHFNKQISIEKIKINSSYNNGTKSFIFSKNNVKKPPSKNLVIIAKEAQKIKEEKKLRDLKKIIASYENQKSFLQQRNDAFPFSSQQSFKILRNNKQCFILNLSDHKISKIAASFCISFIKQPLDYLHKKEYASYNNIFLNNSYSEVFIARPPPAFQV